MAVLLLILVVLLICGISIVAQAAELRRITGESFKVNTNSFVWLDDGRTYVLYRMGPFKQMVFTLKYKGQEITCKAKAKSVQFETAYQLKDRSSTELLMFEAGTKQYLGRLSCWTTYAKEQNLSTTQGFHEILKEVFGCNSQDDITGLYIKYHQPYNGKVLQEYEIKDDAGKSLAWNALMSEAMYCEEDRSILANPKDEDEIDLTICFSSGAKLRFENLKASCKGAKMEYCQEVIVFTEAGQQMITKLLN